MKISHETIKKIAGLLEKEIFLYDNLYDVATSIQGMLVKNDMDELTKFVSQEDNLFTRAESLRQERLEHMFALKDELGLSDSEFGLGKLLEFIDETEAAKLEVLRDKLIDNVNNLNDINKKNHLLVDYSLNLNAQLMNLLVNLGQINPVYQPSGKIKNSPNGKKRLLDKKI